MKKTLLLFAFFTTAFLQAAFAQSPQAGDKTSAVLPAYYQLKDALVAGNAGLAATAAESLAKAVDTAGEDLIAKSAKQSLSVQASAIAKSKDLKKQRDQFLELSNVMVAIAKSGKLSESPVYQMYCPMKKGNWLSSEKAVKNPYYGSAMLACGSVVGTIK